jgi:thioredoxin-related protein
MKRIRKVIVLLVLIALPLTVIVAQNAKKSANTKKTSSKKTKPKKKPTALKMPKEIHWVKGSEIDFEDSAHKVRKPAILYIYVDEGDACPAFYNKVLMDTNIINYVDSNFLAYKLNLEYDSPNAMKYDIDDVPAVILFDRNTQKIDKMEGLHSAAEFKKFLKQVVR